VVTAAAKSLFQPLLQRRFTIHNRSPVDREYQHFREQDAVLLPLITGFRYAILRLQNCGKER
jgi:hypothetical protein